ncbi:MAG: TIGR04190 family B12-binding domain/radical SAM domain protein [Actinomycetota bacterium]|nr:TIGR04190 family B12-binding domain/radical SAM domain protein [Actinomycetota bacterium]
MFGLDLALLHAPSVFDFRRREALLGPIADVVPSSDEFEMYPIGLTSLAGYLSRNAYNVRIVNLAYRMLRSSTYDVAAHLRRIHAPVFGIDLHWLPHAHGALTVAELVKSVHPDAKVLLGGLSASYFHEELARDPAVDFVLRGDSTEEPARQLLQALREGRPLEEVENLTFARPDGTVVVNPLTFVPDDLDDVDVPDYGYALRSVFKYWDLADLVPYLRWLRDPTTMVLNARGCTYDCAICGGSRSAYRIVCNRARPAYRSPDKLVADARTIASFSAAPIFMVHDPRIGGVPRAERFFELFAASGVRNELVIELFYPAGPDFFELVRRSTRAWSLEITIESPDEDLRRVNGKFSCSNAEVEATLAAALEHGCGKLDLFFMVGIPHQRPDQALATVEYCRHLVERFGAEARLQFYVAPLGPFLDPGSRAYEDPALGYRKRFETVAEHRRALEELDWRDVLSFDTDGMDRATLVATTYDVSERLERLKYDAGLIDAATYGSVRDHLARAREVLDALDRSRDLPRAEREEVLRRMHTAVASANAGTTSGAGELSWTPSAGIRVSRALIGELAGALAGELHRSADRFRGRYDTAAAPRRR